MKKLALLAVTAAFVFAPAIADAKGEKTSSETSWWNKRDSQQEQTVTRKTTVYRSEQAYQDATGKVYIDTTEPPKGREAMRVNRPITFTAQTGDRIQVEGQKIYIVNANTGSKYFAPDGPYTTNSGITFIALDGAVLRTEAPDQVVYVDTDELEIREYRAQ
jgi:hypothetical protein